MRLKLSTETEKDIKLFITKHSKKNDNGKRDRVEMSMQVSVPNVD